MDPEGPLTHKIDGLPVGSLLAVRESKHVTVKHGSFELRARSPSGGLQLSPEPSCEAPRFHGRALLILVLVIMQWPWTQQSERA